MRWSLKHPKKTAPVERRRVSRGPEASVYSYRAVRRPSEETLSPQTNRRLRTQFKKVLKNFERVVIVATVGIVLVYYSLLGSVPEVAVTGAQGGVPIRSNAAYKSIAEQAVAGSWWNKNKITLNTKGVAESIRREAPEAREINVRASLLGKRPIVTLSVKSAILRIKKDGKISVLTDDGQLVSVPSGNYDVLPLVEDKSGLPFDAGQKLITTTAVQHIQALEKYFASQAAIKLQSLDLPPAPNEVWARIEGRPYFVKFTFDQDPRVAFGTLLATLKNLSDRRVTPAEYIDVRVEGKVFYK